MSGKKRHTASSMGGSEAALTQISHSYYFITRILVLKFVNKGVLFFRKSRIRIFLEKGGILGLTSVNLEKKSVNFDAQCFIVKKGGSFGLKSQCLLQKGRFIFV